MKIKAIVFDFGGVRLRWSPCKIERGYFSNDLGAAEVLLKTINFVEWNAQQDRGRSFSEGIVVLSKQVPQYAHIAPAFDERRESSIWSMA